ncbi:lipoprotein-releasing ABC transporter permease subunit [Parachitinimonas caeni]|uniref:Lipoprotein-releasing ABC transporter permease subunit n=1 Tax=Parachitinimonas caeni TaxID=3031301 RepID=A0ABT7E1K6_9NEIS|nr:lipoprotein-releasing ABC transporter permease subunit [Parachitinimonas caeni]
MNRFEWLVGLRYTRAKRRNGFISFISLVSMIGIALGVAALIVVLSVMNGFQREIRARILGVTSHLQVTGIDNRLSDWEQVASAMKQHPQVLATAPYVDAQGLLSVEGSVRGAMIRGIDPAKETGVADIAGKFTAGSLDALKAGEFGIVLGREMARNLGVGPGDKVTLITPMGQITPAGMLPRLKSFHVVGIVRLDMYEYDSTLALIQINDAQRLFRMDQAVSGVRAKVRDVFLAPQIRLDLTRQLGMERFVVDWSQQHASYFRAVQIEKRMMFIILTLIVAVAAFNLVSTLVMAVTDKQADIAILRTLGAAPASIMKIFMIQGALAGFIGTLGGVVGGLTIAWNIDVIVPAIERMLGSRILSPEVYFLSDLPSEVLASDVITIAVISLILALLATLYPSWRASRTNPVEALRYE